MIHPAGEATYPARAANPRVSMGLLKERRKTERACSAIASGVLGTAADPGQNRLLAALPAEELARLRPFLELTLMPLGHVLHEAGTRLQHLFFPTTCIVSLLHVTNDGHSAEIANVGDDGVVGLALFMGGETTSDRALVQSGGFAYSMPGMLLKKEFLRGGVLQRLLLRHTQALITQIAQTAVCNSHHSLEQRLCRLLLLSLDRLASSELAMTQDLLALMLGVRRESVTQAAGQLQKLGLIKYARGHIRVLDRPAIEDRACECYGVVKKEFDRLLPPDRMA